MRTILLVLCLLLPMPAFSASWLKHCRAGDVTTAINPGEYICNDPTANDDDTPILAIGGCPETEWFLHTDKDGDATLCTVDWTLQTCPPGAQDLSATARDNACANSTNVLSGNDSEPNLAGLFLRAIGDGAGANAGDCRIVVRCPR